MTPRHDSDGASAVDWPTCSDQMAERRQECFELDKTHREKCDRQMTAVADRIKELELYRAKGQGMLQLLVLASTLTTVGHFVWSLMHKVGP